MNPTELQRRLLALSHHPPDLALTRGEAGRARSVKEVREALGLRRNPSSEEESLLAAADHIASGANEYNFPPDVAFDPDFIAAPVVRHPLSGEERLLDGVSGQTTDGLREWVMAAATALRARYTDDASLALALWRDLPDYLAAASNVPWAALPSDNRIPDHAVWDHLALTAALTTAGIGRQDDVESSTAALLLFTIGPVQGFISAARKTADLWAASYLLAYLTWQAIRVVAEECGPEAVLFPDLRRQPLVDHWLKREKDLFLTAPAADYRSATLPNRFFAVVPMTDAESLADRAEEAIREALACATRFGLDQLANRLRGSRLTFSRETAVAQARGYPEVFWAVLPFQRFEEPDAAASFPDAFKRTYPRFFDWTDAQADDILQAFHSHNPRTTNVGTVYGRLFRIVDGLVGGRKALRDFSAGEESGYRCSLFRELPAIVPDNGANTQPSIREVRAFWDTAAARRQRGKLRAGEQLSSVALARRYLPEWLETQDEEIGKAVQEPFPSTSSIAAADFKADVLGVLRRNETDADRQVRQEALHDALDKFRAKLRTLEEVLPNVGSKPEGPFAETPLRRLIRLAGDSLPYDLLNWLCRLDGTWLFGEGYEAKGVAREYLSEGGELSTNQINALSAAQDAFKGLLSAADVHGIEQPSKYYTVLMLDGDEMGKWLSGEKAPFFRKMLHPHVLKAFGRAGGSYPDWDALLDPLVKVKRPQSPALHLAISRALGTFGLDLVPRIVEEHYLGQLVYSGGDDVLALFSLRSALPAARALRAGFSGQIHGDDHAEPLATVWGETGGYVTLRHEVRASEHDERRTVDVPRLSMGPSATASAGVVFAHYRQPLQHVIALAREAEKYAKNELGRDALALFVAKRSGETVRTGSKWTSLPPNIRRSERDEAQATESIRKENGWTRDVDLVECLVGYANLISSGLVATGLVHDLDAERVGLEGLAGDRAAIEVRLRYLFGRRAERLRFPLPAPSGGKPPYPAWLTKLEMVERAERERRDDEAQEFGQRPPPRRPFAQFVFDAVLKPLLDHAGTDPEWPEEGPLDLKRLVGLLDVARFVGQGGVR